MTTAKEVQRAICEALAAETDPLLAQHSFSRTENSIEYRRQCKDGEQFLRMYFEFKPSYHPGADSRIYPQTIVVFPNLNRVAIDMVGHDALLLGDPEITLSQPIDFAIPKERHVAWYTCGRDSVFDCVRSIRSCLDAWVVPFLNEFTTASSLTTAYEQHDQRFGWQRPFYIYVAAAYILSEQVKRARQVLEDHFGKAGPRRKYAKAFEFVAACVERA